MKCSKAPGQAPLLIVHRTPAALPTDLYVLPEESLETETDISEPSSKILRVSEWAAGVAQAIQDHANAMREVSRQRAEQGKSAARATVMAAVIKMGGSVGDFKKWVKVLEGGGEDDEEEEEEEEEDPKGKKRATGENELEDIWARHHKRQQVQGKEPEVVELEVVEPLVSLRGPSVEIGEPSGSKPKKKSARLVVEDSGGEDSEKEQESEESEAGDYKVKEKGDREKSGTEKSSDD